MLLKVVDGPGIRLDCMGNIMRQIIWAALGFLALLAVGMAPASAQATRTWVSGVGDDVNPCSRTAPCKTFAGAISKTAANGEISVLDPGGFGAVTITKSISIVSDGSEGSILGAGTTGIIINAGVNDVVSIRGLIIEGAASGTNGIRVLQAGSVYVADTVIRGFKAPNGGNGFGFSLESAAAATRVYLRNVEINNNKVGINMTGAAQANRLFVENCTMESNTSSAMTVSGANAVARISNSIFLSSPVALSAGAQLLSTGDNVISGAAPTGIITLQ